jgi:hypothetical protein
MLIVSSFPVSLMISAVALSVTLAPTGIGEGFESFTSGIRLSIARLRELNEQTGTVCCYLYTMLPTWRLISLDGAMFVSAFGETHEGHTSPMYRLTAWRVAPGVP